MTAQLIKGAEVAREIREELKNEVAELKAKHRWIPVRMPCQKCKDKDTEIQRLRGIAERIVEFMLSDKALFPQGTLKQIALDAKQALSGGKDK